MFMHHWSIGMARFHALQALEDEIRRRHGMPRRAPRRWLRKRLAGAVRASWRLLRGLGGRLAAEPRPLGCG